MTYFPGKNLTFSSRSSKLLGSSKGSIIYYLLFAYCCLLILFNIIWKLKILGHKETWGFFCVCGWDWCILLYCVETKWFNWGKPNFFPREDFWRTFRWLSSIQSTIVWLRRDILGEVGLNWKDPHGIAFFYLYFIFSTKIIILTGKSE